MKEFYKSIIVYTIAMLMFLGIPYFFGTGFFWMSWIPALFTFDHFSGV